VVFNFLALIAHPCSGMGIGDFAVQGLCHWQNGGQRGDAVMQLHTGMDPVVRDALEEAVQLYGMRPIIYHDAISKECFGRGFCSATSGMEEWSSHLTNGAHANDPVVPYHFYLYS